MKIIMRASKALGKFVRATPAIAWPGRATLRPHVTILRTWTQNGADKETISNSFTVKTIFKGKRMSLPWKKEFWETSVNGEYQRLAGETKWARLAMKARQELSNLIGSALVGRKSRGQSKLFSWSCDQRRWKLAFKDPPPYQNFWSPPLVSIKVGIQFVTQVSFLTFNSCISIKIFDIPSLD